MRRGDKAGWIEDVIKKLGPKASANEIKAALDKDERDVSLPMIYNVLREYKNKLGESFTEEDHEITRKFVKDVGSWEKAKKLIDFLNPKFR